MSNTLYDLTTLTALITIFSFIVKSISANNKSILTKLILGILAIGILILFIFMVVDININGS